MKTEQQKTLEEIKENLELIWRSNGIQLNLMWIAVVMSTAAAVSVLIPNYGHRWIVFLGVGMIGTFISYRARGQ